MADQGTPAERSDAMHYIIRIRLIVDNEDEPLDFEVVERTLQLGAASKKWRKGDPLDQRSGRLRKTHGLLYRIFEGRNADPVKEATLLLNRLEAAGDAARAMLRKNSSELSIVIRIFVGKPDDPMETPPLHFPREVIEKMQGFGLELDLDLYVFD